MQGLIRSLGFIGSGRVAYALARGLIDARKYTKKLNYTFIVTWIMLTGAVKNERVIASGPIEKSFTKMKV